MKGPGVGNSTSDAVENQVYSAIEWIQFIMATLSIIGSSSIMVYALFQNSLRSPEVRPLFYLSFVDLMLALCWLIGAMLKNQNIACYNLQTISQLFYISSSFYTVNYAWHLYTDLKKKMYGMALWATKYAYRVGRIGIILSSIMPLVLVIPVLSVGNSARCYSNFSEHHRCLLLLHAGVPHSNSSICATMYFYGSGVFQITFLAAIVATMVLILKAWALYKKYSSCSVVARDPQWAEISVAKQRMVLYPLVFFICWTPAAVLLTSKLIAQEENTNFHLILSVLQALTAVSQGLLNCIVYGRTQRMLSHRKRVVCCDEATQTLLSRHQKKFYASIQPTTTWADTGTSTGF